MVARLTKDVAYLTLLTLLATGILASQTALAQNFITVDYPGGTLNEVREINSHGEMAGRYVDAEGVYHGFVLQNGVFTAINFPGALGTAVWGINDNGDLVGRYYDGVTNHGFLLHNGVFKTIDPPGTILTFAEGINNVGQIVGYYLDAAGNEHGFLWSAGVYSTIDFPGSSATDILKVNNVGVMVGIYDNRDGSEHGFLLQNGSFTSIDYPGTFLTDCYGINNGGQIVGGYLATATSNELGFEDNNGTFTTINFPAAIDGLVVEDLNDAAQLAGAYVDADGMEHGFVSATGPFAYVTNFDSNTVSMIDTSTLLPVTNIPVGSGPLDLAISPDGTQVYVGNNSGNDISAIDTASSTVVATIPLPSSPYGLKFTPDGTSVYVATGASQSVLVIDTTSQSVVATVPVAGNPTGVSMALTSNGTFAYVSSNSSPGTVSVIAVGASPTVVQTINVGDFPHSVVVAPNSSLAYVANGGSNTVSVISVATNTVTATIPAGTNPFAVTFTPDSSTAYVANVGSNTISVVDTATSSVLSTVGGFDEPHVLAHTPDGSSIYVTNFGNGTVSVIATASNTITGTVAVGNGPFNVAIAAAPQTSQQITQPLSPTQPNVFNFGTNNYQVQYPPGTQFSGVYMTVTSVEITQAQFQQRVAGTPFANSTCIVYAGAGGNCVDDQVTCSNSPSGTPIITCPSEAQPSIDVQTDFTTQQAIINPGYLTTPIGQNLWQNIFTGYSDPKIKGQTSGFSEFVAVDLGATNPQGLAQFEIIDPQLPRDIVYGHENIPVVIRLTSVANGSAITDAQVSISVVMIADAHGNPTQQVVLSEINAFRQTGPRGYYRFNLDTSNYALGTYNMTIYGNAFPAYQGQFKITIRSK